VIEIRRVIAADELRQVAGGENQVGAEESHGSMDTAAPSFVAPHFFRKRVHGSGTVSIREGVRIFRFPSLLE
jgi:hypothetical protein